MKILIFSDLHIHPHKKSNDRLNHCLEALEWVFDTATKHNINNIVFAGDLFHDRQKIEVYTYQKTFEIFEKYLLNDESKLKIYLLLGNHDLWHLSKTTISSVKPLRAMPNVIIVDKPSTLKLTDGTDSFDCSFLPYTHDPISDLINLSNKSNYRVLFGHLAIDGAILNKLAGTQAEIELELDGDMVKVDQTIFKNWHQVFLGHYHSPQQLSENVEYIGSTLQLTFAEAFDDKHLIIFDTETKKKQYIKNDFSPKHYIINSNELEKYKLDNNFIRLIVDDITSSEVIELKDKLSGKTGSLEIKPKPIKNEEHIIQNAKSILFKQDEMLERYVDEIQKNDSSFNLDHQKLLSIGKLICEGKNE